jgi:arsenate reductase-like glutaredoxin family protein
MSCRKAQEFLEKNDLRPSEQADAGKKPRGKTEALALAKTVDRIVAAKGKKIVTFDMKKDRPDEATLLSHLLGPTGNLRAPTIRKGRTLLVGFNPDAYDAVLKK